MKRDPASIFIVVLSVFSIAEGGLSLLAAHHERSDEFLTFIVKMEETHAALHVLNGVVGALFLWFGGDRSRRIFAGTFGLVYALLGIVGGVADVVGDGALGLGLQALDHPLHVVIGLGGIMAARWSSRRHHRVALAHTGAS